MQVQVEELEDCRVALHVEVEPERVAEVHEKAFKEVAPYVNVPGFRRGKAPRNLVQRYMNQDVLRQHTLSLLVPNAVDEAVKESGLEAYEEPEIEEEPEIAEGEPLKFTVNLTTPPKVELSDYTGQRIEFPQLEIGDEDVERSLSQIREQRSSLQPVERPVLEGDFVTIDYVLHVPGEVDDSGPMLRVAGSSDQPLDQSVLGHSTGDTFTVESPLVNDESVTGTYDITIKEVRNWGLPELNDEFAQKLSFENLDALLQTTRERLQAQAQEMVTDDIEQRLVNLVREKATLAYPRTLVERMAGERMESLIEELEDRNLTLSDYLGHEKLSLTDLETNLIEQARNIIESQLVLSEIAKGQDLQVTQAELAEELGKDTEEERSEAAAQNAANRILYRKIMEFLKANNELVPTGPDGSPVMATADAGNAESEEAGEKKEGLVSRLFHRRKPGGEEGQETEAAAEETGSESEETE